jgi:CheY-like chemotaxis protein
MNDITYRSPKVLFVHDGVSYEAHRKHLSDAGLRVSETRADSALAEAARLQPDIIVLDFACDGEITAQLKSYAPTRHIPIIAFVDLARAL